MSVRSLRCLADDLVAGREGDEVREALHGNRVAVAEVGGDGVVEGKKLGHWNRLAPDYFNSSPSTSRSHLKAALAAGTPA